MPKVKGERWSAAGFGLRGPRFIPALQDRTAACKYTGKGLADFANFSVNDGERFYGKINGVPVKRLNVNFPGSGEYIFAVAGDNI